MRYTDMSLDDRKAYSLAISRRTKALRDGRRAEGLCMACGQRPPRPTPATQVRRFTRCEACILYNQSTRQTARTVPSIESVARLRRIVVQGLGSRCSVCGDQRPDNLMIRMDGVIEQNKRNSRLYRWIVSRGFPVSVSTVCANCWWSQLDGA